MRFVLGALLCAGFLIGCASPNSGSRSSVATKTSDAKAAPASSVTPTLAAVGKIVSINTAVRFVVLEFPLTTMPPIGQTLNVYRGGQKVGEVKISGPQSENNIVADIAAGSLQAGDEVRAD